VDDALAVGLAQPGRDLAGDVQRLGRLERAPLDPVPQRLPLHELHGDVGPVFAFPDLVDDADIRVGERRGRLGLDEEALLELRRVHEMGRQELEGDTALELEVLGLVDDAHPAGPDLIDDLVLAGDERALGDHGQRRRQRPGRQGLAGYSQSQRRRAPAAEPRIFGVLGVTGGTFHGLPSLLSIPEWYYRQRL
jgi:hypothetical protein